MQRLWALTENKLLKINIYDRYKGFKIPKAFSL